MGGLENEVSGLHLHFVRAVKRAAYLLQISTSGASLVGDSILQGVNGLENSGNLIDGILTHKDILDFDTLVVVAIEREVCFSSFALYLIEVVEDRIGKSVLDVIGRTDVSLHFFKDVIAIPLLHLANLLELLGVVFTGLNLLLDDLGNICHLVSENNILMTIIHFVVPDLLLKPNLGHGGTCDGFDFACLTRGFELIGSIEATSVTETPRIHSGATVADLQPAATQTSNDSDRGMGVLQVTVAGRLTAGATETAGLSGGEAFVDGGHGEGEHCAGEIFRDCLSSDEEEQ